MANKEGLPCRPVRPVGREFMSKKPEGTQQRIQFLNAVRNCQFQELEKVLKTPGIDVNLRIRSGLSPLMHAAGKGNAECMNVLIKSGADVNLTDFSYKTALGHAALSKSSDCIALLLGADIDINAETRLNETSIFDVVVFGNEGFVKLVCESGADVNKTNNVGNSPIMFAAIYGHIEIIKCLISFGADVNDVNKTSGQTPLMMAVKKKNLLRLGKHAEKQYYRKPKQHSSLVKVLLEFGANVNMKDHSGRTVLFNAAFHGCVESLRLLLRANADIKACDRSTVYIPFYVHHPDMNPECRKILFAAGREEDTQHMESFYRSHVEDRHSLRHLCRLTIRQRLSPNYPNLNMVVLTDQLPLPNALKSYLLYDML